MNKIGTLDIIKAYLGNKELSANNAYMGEISLIKGSGPTPVEIDYFYLQPLSTGNYSVSTSDEVWKQNTTFEFSLNKTSWRQFSSLAHQEVTTTYTLADFMTANPLNVVIAVEISKYNEYVVSQGFDVGIYEQRTSTGTSSLGKVATLLTTDSNYAYYTCELIDTPTSNLTVRVFFQDDSYFEVRSLSRSITLTVPYMVTWGGTSSAPVVVQPTDYDVSFQYTTLVITETIPLTANDKLYLRNTGGSMHSGIINSIQSVNHNIGGILNTLTDYTDNTYTITSNYAKEWFKGDAHLISAGDLKLPATTLADYCYHSMFNGCTNLTSAPELPATTLASNCYRSMFYGCSSLTSAPELPATTLASNCY